MHSIQMLPITVSKTNFTEPLEFLLVCQCHRDTKLHGPKELTKSRIHTRHLLWTQKDIPLLVSFKISNETYNKELPYC